MNRQKNILIVDDDESLGDVLRDILTEKGYEVRWVANPWQAQQILIKWNPDLALLDLRLPGMSGIDLLRKIQETHPFTTVVMISGHGTIPQAVEATHLGAYDWLEKPLEKERVLLTVKNALMQQQLQAEKTYTVDETLSKFGMMGIVPAMQDIFKLIERVAATDATVLIRGENGAGKELVALALHRNSRRVQAAFVHLNCAAIPDTLIESELFGHVKGSFTGALSDQIGKFAAANHGTLFLDEIGDLSPAAQAKVLRAIESGEVCRIGANKIERVDVRLMAATNKDLESMMAAGTFRPDLYHRLKVIEIVLPPLRNRNDDIIPLAKHFLSILCEKHAITPKTLDANAFAPLLTYAWPGNIRELRNFIERVVILCDADVINAQHIARLLQFPHFQVDCAEENNFARAKACFEKAFLHHALDANHWNVSKTAEQIGMERSVLYKKMEKYGLKKSQKEDNAR